MLMANISRYLLAAQEMGSGLNALTDVAGIAYVTSFAGLAGFLALPLAASADRLTFNPKIHKYSKDMHIFKRLFFV